MIPGRLSVVVLDLAAEVAAEFVGAVDRVLDRLAGGPAVPNELANAAMAAIGVDRQRSVGVDADTLHHGCWALHVCAVHNTVSVVHPTAGCPICDSSPAATPEPAGDRPAVMSDGLATTAPTAGHPNPMYEAAAADQRIAKRLNDFIGRRRR